MSRSATLSPLGLYNWDNTLFDLFTIPSGLNKDTLLNNLLAETAELEVLYPNPIVMKNLIGVWSQKQVPVWERLLKTTQYKYNPIENYDRYEEGTTQDTGSANKSGTASETGNESRNGADNRTIDRDRGGTDTTTDTINEAHFIAGFDSQASGDNDGLVKQSRDEHTNTAVTRYGSTEDITDNTAHTETNNSTKNSTHGETETTNNTGKHSLHVHGNIGVMSAQTMIQQQREIDLFNLYDIIIEEFRNRFCILIY